MKQFLLFICVFLLINFTYSQKREADSLKQVIDNYKETDSTYIKLRNSYLARQLFSSPSDSALFDFANTTLRIAKTLDYTEGKIISHNNLGVIYQYRLSDPYKAINHYQESLNISTNNPKFRQNELSTLHNVGIIYYELKDYDLALSHFKAMLKGNPTNINALTNVGNVFGELKQSDSAVYYYKKGITEAKRSKNYLHLGNLQSNLATILAKSDQIEDAIYNIESSLHLVDSFKLEFIRTPVYSNAALVYLKNKDYNKAETYALQGLSLNKSLNNLFTEKSLWEILASVYEAKENYPEAIEARKKFTLLNDSVSNIDKRLEVSRKQLQSEANQKQVLAQKEIEKQRSMTRMSILIGALTILLLIIMFFVYQKKQKAKLLSKESNYNSTVENLQEKINKSDLSKDVKVLFQDIKVNKSKRISIPTQDGLTFLETSEIIYCEANTSYTNIHIKDKKIVVSKPLKHYEELLNDSNFYRIHNSKLINLNHVVKYTKGKGGYVTMSNKTIIDVSTRRKDGFLKLIEG